MNKSKVDRRLELPFDQYSRQEIARALVDNYIRPVAKKEGVTKLKIIDLGGHKGHTKDFFPNDEVFILDVFEEEYTGYIKGDATATTFHDGEFDVVVSFDTFEHIPQDKRRKFLVEASRISKYAFVLAAPFDNKNDDISTAEKMLNNLYKETKLSDHPWLKEHIDYGIPKKKMIERYLDDIGITYTNVPTNNLKLWMFTQGLMFNTSLIPGDIREVVDVSRFYNRNLLNLESIEGETYRQIYIGATNKNITAQLKGNEKLFSTTESTARSELEYINLVNKAYAEAIKRLYNDRQYLLEREAHLQKSYDNVETLRARQESELNDLKRKHPIYRAKILKNKAEQLRKQLFRKVN